MKILLSVNRNFHIFLLLIIYSLNHASVSSKEKELTRKYAQVFSFHVVSNWALSTNSLIYQYNEKN